MEFAVIINSISPAQTFLEKKSYQLYIGGEWVDPQESEWIVNHDPSTGAEIGAIARGSVFDVDRAVAAATAALEGPWSKFSPDERGALLWRIADLISDHANELAEIESVDSGKPITATKAGDLPGSSEVFRYYAGAVTKIAGDARDLSRPGLFGWTHRRPIGVCGQIIPWNYPLQMAAWKLAPALAAGCTLVLKPSELTSLSVLRLMELLQQTDLPDGVVNIVTGLGPEAGSALASHPGIAKVAFTGSTNVGRQVMVAAAQSNLKNVTLELGGKSPNLVFEDADMDKALPGVTTGVFSNMGQNCTAGSRVLVHSSRFDEVAAYMTEAAHNLKIGPGPSPTTEIGPLVSDVQRCRVEDYINLGISEGAQSTVERTLPTGLPDGGFYVRPTVLIQVTNEMRVCREEIFGPVVCLLPFSDEAEAIRIANDTEYGLGAGVWTSNLDRAHRTSRALNAGVVWINTYNSTDTAMPFGGMHSSGIGRELGPEGIEAYLELKSIALKVAP